MTMVAPRIVAGAVLLVAVSLTGLATLVYALWKWCHEAQRKYLPIWRRVAAFAGFVAVTMQGASFVAFWSFPQIGRDNVLFRDWARWVFAFFLVAIPCVLAGKGASRWWLLSSSVLLFIICFFIVLIP
jgi:cation transport ATPase